MQDKMTETDETPPESRRAHVLASATKVFLAYGFARAIRVFHPLSAGIPEHSLENFLKCKPLVIIEKCVLPGS